MCFSEQLFSRALPHPMVAVTRAAHEMTRNGGNFKESVCHSNVLVSEWELYLRPLIRCFECFLSNFYSLTDASRAYLFFYSISHFHHHSIEKYTPVLDIFRQRFCETAKSFSLCFSSEYLGYHERLHPSSVEQRSVARRCPKTSFA